MLAVDLSGSMDAKDLSLPEEEWTGSQQPKRLLVISLPEE